MIAELLQSAVPLLTGEGLPAALGQLLPEWMVSNLRTPVATLPEPQRPSYLPVEGKSW